MVYFANLCVNPSAIGFASGGSRAGLRDRLCDVARHVSAQPQPIDSVSSRIRPAGVQAGVGVHMEKG